MDDVAAGWTFGIFGFLISFYGLLIGFLIDALGTQRSLVLGSCLLICGRLLLAVAVDTTTLYLALYLTIPLGEALAIPVLTVMLKRYTLPQNRAAAYSLFYVTMNLGTGFRHDATRGGAPRAQGRVGLRFHVINGTVVFRPPSFHEVDHSRKSDPPPL